MRELKSNNASEADITAAVSHLLVLKQQYREATGEDLPGAKKGKKDKKKSKQTKAEASESSKEKAPKEKASKEKASKEKAHKAEASEGKAKKPQGERTGFAPQALLYSNIRQALASLAWKTRLPSFGMTLTPSRPRLSSQKIDLSSPSTMVLPLPQALRITDICWLVPLKYMRVCDVAI